MNQKNVIFLLISATLNILFFLTIALFFAKPGSFDNLSKKTSSILNYKSQAFPLPHNAYYSHRLTQLKILPKSQNEIIFLGDSITDECEWAELLENPNIKNRGISGDTINLMMKRLNEILESKPKQIFLMVGINDFFQNDKSAQELAEDYKKILTEIRNKSPNTQVFIQSVLPVNKTKYKIKVDNGNIVKLNFYLKELAQEFSWQYIDLFYHLSDSKNQLDSSYTLDGLHLNGQGYLVWKQVIEKYIVK